MLLHLHRVHCWVHMFNGIEEPEIRVMMRDKMGRKADIGWERVFLGHFFARTSSSVVCIYIEDVSTFIEKSKLRSIHSIYQNTKDLPHLNVDVQSEKI